MDASHFKDSSDFLPLIHQLTYVRRLPNETFYHFLSQTGLSHNISSCPNATGLDVTNERVCKAALCSLSVLSAALSSIPSDIHLKLDMSSYKHDTVDTVIRVLPSFPDNADVPARNLLPSSNLVAGVAFAPYASHPTHSPFNRALTLLAVCRTLATVATSSSVPCPPGRLPTPSCLPVAVSSRAPSYSSHHPGTLTIYPGSVTRILLWLFSRYQRYGLAPPGRGFPACCTGHKKNYINRHCNALTRWRHSPSAPTPQFLPSSLTFPRMSEEYLRFMQNPGVWRHHSCLIFWRAADSPSWMIYPNCCEWCGFFVF